MISSGLQNQKDRLIPQERQCKNVGMQFWISKCAMLTIKRVRKSLCYGIEQSSREAMMEPKECRNNYLGILRPDDILHNMMKDKVGDTYLKRLKLVELKLHTHKQIVTINTWVVQLDTVV